MELSQFFHSESFMDSCSDRYDIQNLIEELGGATPRISPIPPKTMQLKRILPGDLGLQSTISARREAKMKSKEERTQHESVCTSAIMPVESGYSISPTKLLQAETRKRRSGQAKTEAANSEAEAFITPRRAIISEPSSPVAVQDTRSDFSRPTYVIKPR